MNSTRFSDFYFLRWVFSETAITVVPPLDPAAAAAAAGELQPLPQQQLQLKFQSPSAAPGMLLQQSNGGVGNGNVDPTVVAILHMMQAMNGVLDARKREEDFHSTQNSKFRPSSTGAADNNGDGAEGGKSGTTFL